MTPTDAQALTDEIRRMAEAKGMAPIDLLKEMVAREKSRDRFRSEASSRDAMRNHKLRLVKL